MQDRINKRWSKKKDKLNAQKKSKKDGQIME